MESLTVTQANLDFVYRDGVTADEGNAILSLEWDFSNNLRETTLVSPNVNAIVTLRTEAGDLLEANFLEGDSPAVLSWPHWEVPEDFTNGTIEIRFDRIDSPRWGVFRRLLDGDVEIAFDVTFPPGELDEP